jgi:hypothetical protein
MSGETDTKNMKFEISFRNGICQFCNRNYKSTSCLLPYSLIKSTVVSENRDEMIEQVTMIHVEYGKKSLAYNHSITAQYIDDQIDLQVNETGFKESTVAKPSKNFASDVKKTKDTNKSLKAESDLNKHQIDTPVKTITSKEDKANETKKFTDPKINNSETVTVIKNDKSPVLKTATPIVKETETKSKQNDSTPAKKAKTLWSEIVDDDDIQYQKDFLERISKQQTAKQAKPQSNETIKNDYNHIISDLTIAFGAAAQLQRHDRAYVNVSALFKSLEFELDIMSKVGSKYSPSMNTELNHSNPIAKEICGTHTKDELYDWAETEYRNHPPGCLLSFDRLRYDSELQESNKLSHSLLRYIKYVLDNHVKDTTDKRNVLNEVKTILENRDMPSAYPWSFQEMQTSNNVRKPETRLRLKSTSLQSHNVTQFPILDESTKTIIDKIVPTEVQTELSRYQDSDLYHDESVELKQFYLVLVREFITRNRAWRNVNSFQTKAHVLKLLQTSSFSTKTSSLDEVLSLVSNILQKVRLKSK